MTIPPIVLDAEVRDMLRVAAVGAAPVVIDDACPSLSDAMRREAEEHARRWTGLRPADIAALAPARTLYRAFGIDPTRTRPSSEALLRRVLKGQPLPRISNAVDLCNLLALRFMLPLGLYDLARVEGPVSIRRGKPGEAFAGIRKDTVNVAGRPVVADAVGAFGNPTSDSSRTAVGRDTRSLLLVVFAPGDTACETISGYAEAACAEMRRHLGDAVVATVVEIARDGA